MIQSYRSKHVCIYDYGLFEEIAVKLAKYFGKVSYFCPWKNGFPKSNQLRIGDGIVDSKRNGNGEYQRIEHFFDVIPEVDLFIFPDTYDGDLQLHLQDLGKRVWGSRFGDDLELDRVASKKFLTGLGLDIGPYEVVTGLDSLREYLKEHEDVYVKISKTRGDMESFHALEYKLIEPKLDELEHTLGAMKNRTVFIVEEAIKDAVEIAWDSFSVDGQYPKKAMLGAEKKSEAYAGKVFNFANLPKQVREVYEKIAPALKDFEYKNFISIETMSTPDKKCYVTDPCCRNGSPPTENELEMIENLPDILWFGAEGKLIEPEYKDTWAVQVNLLSSWAESNWQCLYFPPKIRDSIKLRNFAVMDGEYYVLPQPAQLSLIGAVVATGSTFDDARDKVITLAEQVKGYYIDVPFGALSALEKELDKLKQMGIPLR
jgi:hypothetical protein